jgi:hypothetical protein
MPLQRCQRPQCPVLIRAVQRGVRQRHQQLQRFALMDADFSLFMQFQSLAEKLIRDNMIAYGCHFCIPSRVVGPL